jgi:CBS domain containing-hemolysin-like protein
MNKGYSRLPVYKGNDRKKILGVLRLKQLIGIDKNNNKKIKDLKLTLIPPLIISSEVTAVELLNELKKSTNHIAFVAKNFKDNRSIYHCRIEKGKIDKNILNAEIIGIVTLEDVLGKLFNISNLDFERENNKKFFKSNSLFDNLTTRNNSRTTNNSLNELFSRSRSSANTYVNIDEISPDNSYKLMEEN